MTIEPFWFFRRVICSKIKWPHPVGETHLRFDSFKSQDSALVLKDMDDNKAILIFIGSIEWL